MVAVSVEHVSLPRDAMHSPGALAVTLEVGGGGARLYVVNVHLVPELANYKVSYALANLLNAAW